MDNRAALLRAIRENPDDDTVRLVYADWLEENGERRLAQFIRLQIRLFAMWTSGGTKPEEPDDPERDQRYLGLLFQEKALLYAGPMWTYFQNLLNGSTAPLETHFDVRNIERGFPDRIEPCNGNWWAANGDKVLEQLPIRAVAFWDLPGFKIDAEGFRLTADPRAVPIEILDEGMPDHEDVTLGACRQRWPEVKFERLPRPFVVEAEAGEYRINPTGRVARVNRVSRLGQGR